MKSMVYTGEMLLGIRSPRILDISGCKKCLEYTSRKENIKMDIADSEGRSLLGDPRSLHTRCH